MSRRIRHREEGVLLPSISDGRHINGACVQRSNPIATASMTRPADFPHGGTDQSSPASAMIYALPSSGRHRVLNTTLALDAPQKAMSCQIDNAPLLRRKKARGTTSQTVADIQASMISAHSSHRSAMKEPVQPLSQADVGLREKAWNGRVCVSERVIPEYDAMNDKHCTYTRRIPFNRHYESFCKVTAIPSDTAVYKRGLPSRPQQYPPSVWQTEGALSDSISGATMSERLHSSLTNRYLAQTPLSAPPGSAPVGGSRSHLPSLEQAVLQAVQNREACVSMLTHFLNTMPVMEESDLLSSARRKLAQMLGVLRVAAVEVVEAIGKWQRRQPTATPFMVKGNNYMHQMCTDLHFLGLNIATDPFVCRYEPARWAVPVGVDTSSWRIEDLTADIFLLAKKHSKHDLVRVRAAEKMTLAQLENAEGLSFDAPDLLTEELQTSAQHCHLLLFADAAANVYREQMLAKQQEQEAQDAAIKIQSITRGKHTREQVRQRKAILESELSLMADENDSMQQSAALTIQKRQRGKQAKKTVAARRTDVEKRLAAMEAERLAREEAYELNGAALNIQRHVKGRAARRDMVSKRQELEERLAQLEQQDAQQDGSMDSAALAIQTSYRGKQGRKAVQNKKQQKQQQQQQQQQQAASVIGKHGKGRVARKQLTAKQEAAAAMAPVDAADEEKQQQAAVLIQSRARGNKQRQQLVSKHQRIAKELERVNQELAAASAPQEVEALSLRQSSLQEQLLLLEELHTMDELEHVQELEQLEKELKSEGAAATASDPQEEDAAAGSTTVMVQAGDMFLLGAKDATYQLPADMLQSGAALKTAFGEIKVTSHGAGDVVEVTFLANDDV